MKTPKFSRLRRLVTERDAKRIRRHGRIVSINPLDQVGGRMIVRKYRGATYTEFERFTQP